MTTEVRMKKNEAYMYYMHDGVWDIFLGYGLLLFGLMMLADATALVALIAITPMLAREAKKRYTAPRMSQLETESAASVDTGFARRMMVISFGLAFLLGLIVFLLFTGAPAPLVSLMRSFAPLVFGGLLAGIMIVMAAVLRVRRYYSYAVMTFLAAILSQVLGINPGFAILTAGGVIVIAGLLVLQRLIRHYPLSKAA